MSKVAYVLGDDISTDHIYPGRYMATVLPSETPQYCFADMADLNGALKEKKFSAGSIIVGGSNFGCGSSREQAASTIRGHELVVVARSFARIFLQNAVNLGLPLITCPEITADAGDELDILSDKIVNRTKGKEFAIVPLPKLRQEIMDSGGLISYTRKRLERKLAQE